MRASCKAKVEFRESNFLMNNNEKLNGDGKTLILYEVLKVYNINKSKGMFLSGNVPFDFLSLHYNTQKNSSLSTAVLHIGRLSYENVYQK